MNTVTFAQTIEGYLLAANARHLSQNTINDYVNTFRKFSDFLGDDPPLTEITHNQVEEFLSSQQVSNKTILNYHTGLSALWTWAASENLAPENIVQRVRRAKPEKKAIVPYSQMDIKALLAAAGHSASYTRPGKREAANTVPQAERT